MPRAARSRRCSTRAFPRDRARSVGTAGARDRERSARASTGSSRGRERSNPGAASRAFAEFEGRARSRISRAGALARLDREALYCAPSENLVLRDALVASMEAPAPLWEACSVDL